VKQIGSNHALWPSVTGKGEDPAQWPADLRVQDFPQRNSSRASCGVFFDQFARGTKTIEYRWHGGPLHGRWLPTLRLIRVAVFVFKSDLEPSLIGVREVKLPVAF